MRKQSLDWQLVRQWNSIFPLPLCRVDLEGKQFDLLFRCCSASPQLRELVAVAKCGRFQQRLGICVQPIQPQLGQSVEKGEQLEADSIATTHTVLAWNTGTEVSAITSPAMQVSHQP